MNFDGAQRVPPNDEQDPRPEFVDNRNGNTLDVALNGYIEYLTRAGASDVQVSIASGYFNPEGFARLAGSLARVSKVRLMLGAEPVPPPTRPVRHLNDPRGARFEKKLLSEALARTDAGLLRDRDLLAFNPSTDEAVRKLLAFLRSGAIEVRRYEARFLHGKAFIFSGPHGAIAGSSNFTAGGLAHNLELNVGTYQPSVLRPIQQWFEELWAEALPFDLAAIYAARFEEFSPYLIFLRVLWERYQDELETERTPTGTINLTRFQYDGLERAKRILARYNGVLIADSVGLGKTFLAGKLLQDTIERERKRALLIAPAALRDGTWARFKARHQLGLEVRSYEEVMADKQLGGTQQQLDADIGQYSLIVVDEAHAYRHADTARAQALRRLLRGDPPKQVVLMTATPVNNSLWDLYNQLAFFVGHDAVFADIGIPSMKAKFDQAAKHDPFTLKPQLLFDILDATTVRRTRHFVKRFYPDDRILVDGQWVAVQFPRPHVQTRSYDIEEAVPGLLDDFAAALAPEEGDPLLTMARYSPSRYRREATGESRELALVGLIRTGLLKRFESSAHAFANTLERIVRAHDALLSALERNRLPTPELLAELTAAEDDEQWDELLSDGETIDADEYKVDELRRDLQRDRQLLEGFRARAATVRQGSDPKLHILVEMLVEILHHAEEHGIGEEDRRNRRKVLVFSYFADTVEWIADYLLQRIASDHRLAAYRGRLAAVRGTEGYAGVGRREAVYGFAPVSAEAPPGWTEDKYDILVTTDVLAEGMNLQQASRIINYDLPWNPMRLVQRHGRIDRIGSPHADVWIECIFPDQQIDRMLKLETRIRIKLAQAAAAIGLDDEVIPGIDVVERNFADTREEIERLRQGDAAIFENGGEDVHAHSGEEYRQELRKALSEGLEKDIISLPGAAGSGLRRGRVAGHFFCARIDDKLFLRFVPFNQELPIIRDALGCLQTITCTQDTQRVLSDDVKERAYAAWERARADILKEWTLATDPRNLTPKIPKVFRDAATHVRGYRPAEMTIEEADRICVALEAPRATRDERALRKLIDAPDGDAEDLTRRIAEFVRERGYQPWRAPEPLPPIEEGDISLVVWMGVEEQLAP